MKKGDLVFDAVYQNKVEQAKYWYTPSSLKTIVRLDRFLLNDITMLPIYANNNNKLPRDTGGKFKDKCKGVKFERIGNDDVDFIVDKVYRGNQIDAIEDTKNYDFDMTDYEISLESMD